MRKIVEQTIPWRGSVTDLATDVAWLLTPKGGKELISELQRFLDLPDEAHKWGGKGHRDEAQPTGYDRGIAALRALKGADAIFRGMAGDQFYVVAREHGIVDMDRLIEAEGHLREELPNAMVGIWAHQGRDLEKILRGYERLR